MGIPNLGRVAQQTALLLTLRVGSKVRGEAGVVGGKHHLHSPRVVLCSSRQHWHGLSAEVVVQGVWHQFAVGGARPGRVKGCRAD